MLAECVRPREDFRVSVSCSLPTGYRCTQSACTAHNYFNRYQSKTHRTIGEAGASSNVLPQPHNIRKAHNAVWLSLCSPVPSPLHTYQILYSCVEHGNTNRNPNSKLNQEIEEEVSAFTARSNQQPTDDEFLELENAIRELRAKYIKNGRGSEIGSRGSGGSARRGSAVSGRGGGTRDSSKRGVSGNMYE